MCCREGTHNLFVEKVQQTGKWSLTPQEGTQTSIRLQSGDAYMWSIIVLDLSFTLVVLDSENQ
jgi:hypothetical protein